MIKEAICFLIRETGWSLEYIAGLPLIKFYALVEELRYQRACDDYKEAFNFARLQATLCSDKTHRYGAEDFIGSPPERNERRINLTDFPKVARVVGHRRDTIKPISRSIGILN